MISEFTASMPVLLLWINRFSIIFIAYMYNSYIGFSYLCWICLSFLMPVYYYYTISIWFVVPTVIF